MAVAYLEHEIEQDLQPAELVEASARRELDPVRDFTLGGRVIGLALAAGIAIETEMIAVSELHPDLAATGEFMGRTAAVAAISYLGYKTAKHIGSLLGHGLGALIKETGTLD